MSDGFERANELAKKFIYLQNLMRQQFSKMEHYDFGLRSMKSVLRNAGSLRRDLKNKERDEQLILLEAVRTMNESKLTSSDKMLFDELLKDLFKEKATVEQERDVILQSQVKKAFEDNNLVPVDSLITKCCQTQESIRVRHGNMFIGSTLSGKTTVWQMLAKALEAMDNQEESQSKVSTQQINPKSASVEDLQGYQNLDTGDWTDGILAKTFREVCSVEAED